MTYIVSAPRIIRIAGSIASLAVLWQVVRLCQGSFQVPGVEEFTTSLSQFAGPPDSTSFFGGITTWLWKAWSFLFSLVLIAYAANLIGNVGNACARIVEVGFDQYRAEVREAEEQARRAQILADARQRRYERRQRQREALRPRDTTNWLLVGTLLGLVLL